MNKFLLIIVSAVLPPLGVALAGGKLEDVLINTLLTLVLCYVGGLAHAAWFICSKGGDL